MPFLLFGAGLPTAGLSFQGLGGEFGQRTRWYDIAPSSGVDGHAHLVALFAAARRHGCYVALSSWEYQQSSALAGDCRWWDRLRAIPPRQRTTVLANCLADLVEYLDGHGLADRIAFVELHNEAQAGYLTDAVPPGVPPVVGLRDTLERGIAAFKARRGDQLVAVNFAEVPVGQLHAFPRNADVAVFHPYCAGALGELLEVFALRAPQRPFPQVRAERELLRSGAPAQPEWLPPAVDAWRMAATIVSQREVYLHDWCDPQKWDAWLYQRHALYAAQQEAVLALWIAAAHDLAVARDIPLVFGEGWVGYTPLGSRFEDGPTGAGLCRLAARLAAEAGAWGSVVCSNAAPHHPMWADVALQREVNDAFTG